MKILYAKSHNAGIGKIWQRDNGRLSDFIKKHKGGRGILEIGGGNGILNSIYSKKYGEDPRKIIQPSEI